MSSDFLVTIMHPIRRAQWQSWIGTDTVCVRAPITERARLGAAADPVGVYVLDETQLDPAQQAALCAGLAALFQAPVEDVRAEMHTQGIAIKAVDCLLAARNPQWCDEEGDAPYA